MQVHPIENQTTAGGAARPGTRPAGHGAAALALACVLALPAAGRATITIEATHLEPTQRLQADLPRAIAVVARHRAAWPDDDVTVRLPPGRVQLTGPLELDRRVSGRAGRPVRIVGAPDGSTVLSTATVPRWQPASAAPPSARDRLPPPARATAWRAELPPGAGHWDRGSRHGQGHGPQAAPSEVIWRGHLMPQAAWPAAGYARIEAVGDGGTRLSLAGRPLVDRPREPQAWLHGYFGQDWADEWIALEAVDPRSGDLLINGKPPLYGAQVGQRVRVVNLLSELDAPGEWAFDDDGRHVWFWPPAADEPDAALTAHSHVVRVVEASHIVLSELTFEGSRGDALQIVGGRDVRVERSRFRRIGGQAVAASGTAHAVVDCDIEHTGQGGINLWGGDRRTLEPGGHVASGNRLRHVNRWTRTYRPAVATGGVGNTVRGNLISDAPHAAIIFWGNEHLIEFNVITRVAQETGDVGAIYAGNDWTARGTVIRHNHLHDIRGPGRWGSRGVYLDDQLSGTVVQGNLFVGVDRPVFIGGGRDNLVDNNLFVDSTPAIHLDRRGRSWQQARTDDPEGPLRRALRAVPFDRPPYADRYPTLPRLLTEAPGEPRGNVARRNAVVGGVPLEIEAGAGAGLEVDRLFDEAAVRWRVPAIARDPARATDYELDDASPARRDGLAPLRLREMACTRLRWDTARLSGQNPAPCP